MSKATFISGLNAALGTSLGPTGTPSPQQLRSYFQTLDPAAALAVYEDYASSYYVHAFSSTAVPGSDVQYAGGACDAWSEVTSHRVLDQGRRVIDCEGFAWLGHTLLGEAGFIPRGFRIYYIPAATPGQDPTDWHIIAIMQFPLGSSTPSRRVFIGGPRVSDSLHQEGQRVYPTNWLNAELAPWGVSPSAAIQNMMEHAASEDTAEPAQFAPPRFHGPALRRID